MDLSTDQVAAIKNLWFDSDYTILDFKIHQTKEERTKMLHQLTNNVQEKLAYMIYHHILELTDWTSAVKDLSHYMAHHNYLGQDKHIRCFSPNWKLIHWVNSKYQLLDFNGWIDDTEYGSICLYHLDTGELTVLAYNDDQELELSTENQEVLNILLDYEEWRTNL